MRAGFLKEKNPVIQAAIESLLEVGEASDYGRMFRFDELYKISGLTNGQLYQTIRRTNTKLLRSKKMYKNVRAVGYQIATPKLQIEHGEERRRRSLRQALRGKYEIENIRMDKLSSDEKEKHAKLNTILTNIVSDARRRTIRGIKATKISLKRQTETLDYIDQMKGYLDNLKAQLSPS